jgi:hypothetical protein
VRSFRLDFTCGGLYWDSHAAQVIILDEQAGDTSQKRVHALRRGQVLGMSGYWWRGPCFVGEAPPRSPAAAANAVDERVWRIQQAEWDIASRQERKDESQAVILFKC